MPPELIIEAAQVRPHAQANQIIVGNVAANVNQIIGGNVAINNGPSECLECRNAINVAIDLHKRPCYHEGVYHGTC